MKNQQNPNFLSFKDPFMAPSRKDGGEAKMDEGGSDQNSDADIEIV